MSVPVASTSPVAPRRQRRVRRATPLEIVSIVIVSAVSAVLAALAAGQPTGLTGVDVVLRMTFAAILPLAATRANRWTWLVIAGAGALVVEAPEWRAFAYAGLALALYGAIVASSRQRVVGAVVGAVAAQSLLRGGPLGPHGTTAALAGLATLVLLVSAYRQLHALGRGRARWAAVAVGVFVVASGASFGYAVMVGRPAMNEAVDKTQRGVDAARSGQQEQAAQLWDEAAPAFLKATDAFDAPWARPALLIPILSQHAQTISAVATSGHDISRSAATAARVAPYRDLRSTDGQVNVELIRSMRQPLDDAAASLRQARARTEGIDSGWLAPALAGPLRTYQDNLAKALPEAELAQQAVEAAPGLLGANGDRHYFIAFGTPSESRFLGGFIGAYGELTASKGKFTLARSGKIGELNPPAGASPVLSGPRTFIERYNRYAPARFLQNMSASPDFPTVAQVISELYTKTTGQPVDGSIYVDPYALAGFLEFTGPIKVEGVDEPLTKANAAEFLLTGQYQRFAKTDERNDYLGEVSKVTFETLTKAKLPGPAKLAETLGPLVEQRRLLFSVRDDAEQQFLRRIGMTGDFPDPGDQDFFAVKTANANPNKIDSFLTRDITYNATFNPETGEVRSTATVRLTNSAPTGGLPDYVIGNRETVPGTPDRPRGSNTMYLSLYTPLRVDQARSNNVNLPLEAQDEFGLNVYSSFVTVLAGQTLDVTFDLTGTVRAGANYHLGLSSQPTVHADRLKTSVRPIDGYAIATPGQAPSAMKEEQMELTRNGALEYSITDTDP